MTKDLISIIIPCWNISKFLSDCFKGLDNQTYKNFEVIFIDDGSTDDTLNVLEEYCKDKENCHVFSQKNQGPSAARNNGISHANGEFIYFCDADDMIAPNILEVLKTNIDGFDISMCKYRLTKEKFPYKKVKAHKCKKLTTFVGTEELLSQHLCTWPFNVNLWNKLYRHSIIQQMDNYPNVINSEIFFGEDMDFNFNYLSLCQKAIFTPTKLYYYRMRKGSEVHSKFNAERKLSIFKAHRKNIQVCAEKYPNVEQYVRAFVCVSCIEMLFRISASDFDDREIIRDLFNALKKNKNCLKAKKMKKFWRFVINPTIFILHCRLWKKLKTKKEKTC